MTIVKIPVKMFMSRVKMGQTFYFQSFRHTIQIKLILTHFSTLIIIPNVK